MKEYYLLYECSSCKDRKTIIPVVPLGSQFAQIPQFTCLKCYAIAMLTILNTDEHREQIEVLMVDRMRNARKIIGPDG